MWRGVLLRRGGGTGCGIRWRRERPWCWDKWIGDLRGCEYDESVRKQRITDSFLSNGRQLYQVLAAVLLVGGTSAGAFILSFNTPTVGLGCRTGGYVIFFLVALILLVAEVLTWWLTSPLRSHARFRTDLEAYFQHPSLHHRPRHTSLPGLASSKIHLAHLLRAVERLTLQLALLPIRLLPSSRKAQKLQGREKLIKEHFATLENLTLRNWLQRAFWYLPSL
jgi:hypothetical protein